MRSACLVDTTRCIGCRSCQVACKQSNQLAEEHTKFFAAPGGYQNPGRFSPRTFTYVSYHEVEGAGGATVWTFVKHQCMHCTDLYCAQVCAPRVFRKTSSGVVAYEPDNCIGCAACVDACPFDVPAIDYWDLATPHVRKCSFCLERQESQLDEGEVDGRPLSAPAAERYRRSFQTPACGKACPADALQFGDRDELLAEAKRRIAAEPEKYVDHVYGEKEAGGTGWLYLARVPFEKLGFPMSFEKLDMYQKVDG
ncbi:MAG: hypothetical protein A2V98_17370 [Planctomycetes bacterium RBG_16_64_12]|nr:MAG: hypothetical protein A2V98_17370 [Planctomycetes bacterium RBG_16_64_12]